MGLIITFPANWLNYVSRCTWQNNPCNLGGDFNTTVTDLGVCYTFNGMKPALSVSEPGQSSNVIIIITSRFLSVHLRVTLKSQFQFQFETSVSVFVHSVAVNPLCISCLITWSPIVHSV